MHMTERSNPQTGTPAQSAANNQPDKRARTVPSSAHHADSGNQASQCSHGDKAKTTSEDQPQPMVTVNIKTERIQKQCS